MVEFDLARVYEADSSIKLDLLPLETSKQLLVLPWMGVLYDKLQFLHLIAMCSNLV